MHVRPPRRVSAVPCLEYLRKVQYQCDDIGHVSFMNEGKNTELHDFPAPNPPSPTLNKSNQSLTSFNKQYDVSLRWRKPVLSVYTRHSADCKYVRNRLYRRCSCPKWIGGRADHKRFRKSAGTRHWDIAEKYQLRLEEAWIKGLPPSVALRNMRKHKLWILLPSKDPQLLLPL